QIMAPMRAAADQVLDTSILSLPEFRRVITASHDLDRGPGLGLSVVSFSYRQGLPREADLVFDVRFLDNPFYKPGLKARTGDDP
ncbi:RNase adapter RapZ, partial [Acinetobacter baumannii]